MQQPIPLRPDYAAARRCANAARQRAYRRRKQRGERVVGVRVSDKVIEALLRRGLPDADSRRRAKVAAELTEILEAWASHYLTRDA